MIVAAGVMKNLGPRVKRVRALRCVLFLTQDVAAKH